MKYFKKGEITQDTEISPYMYVWDGLVKGTGIYNGKKVWLDSYIGDNHYYFGEYYNGQYYPPLDESKLPKCLLKYMKDKSIYQLDGLKLDECSVEVEDYEGNESLIEYVTDYDKNNFIIYGIVIYCHRLYHVYEYDEEMQSILKQIFETRKMVAYKPELEPPFPTEEDLASLPEEVQECYHNFDWNNAEKEVQKFCSKIDKTLMSKKLLGYVYAPNI